jgi:hypothetical protein
MLIASSPSVSSTLSAVVTIASCDSAGRGVAVFGGRCHGGVGTPSREAREPSALMTNTVPSSNTYRFPNGALDTNVVRT